MLNQSKTKLNKPTQNKSLSTFLIKNKDINKPSTESIRNNVKGYTSKSGRGIKLSSSSLTEKVHASKTKVSPLRQPVTVKPNPKTLSRRRHLKITDFYQPEDLVDSSKTSLRPQDVTKFAEKFQRLTETIVKVATSEEPLELHSLEALLSQEIEKSVGPTTTNPKLSQHFIHATRNLLDNLVCIYEEGGINSKFLPSRTTEEPTFVKAKSSTTVSYRDQYLKELVMNMLQSMCSNKVEEEINKASTHVHNLSAESMQRIHAIRDMVRTEAGIEPEAFHQLDRELKELQRTLSKNKLKVLNASREVERVISEHLERKSPSLNSLQIPNAAMEALKKSKEVTGGDCGDKGTVGGCCKYDSGCPFNNNLSKTVIRRTNSSFRNVGKHEEITQPVDSLIDMSGKMSSPGLDMKNDIKRSFELKDEIIEQIRPEIQKMVQDELLKVKEKSAMFFIGADGFQDSKFSINQVDRSPEEYHYKNVYNYSIENKAISIPDTKGIQQNLKTDLWQNEKMVAKKCTDKGFNAAKRNECKLLVENCKLRKYDKGQETFNSYEIDNLNLPSKTTMNNADSEQNINPAREIVTEPSKNNCTQRNFVNFVNKEIMCEKSQIKNNIPIKMRSKCLLGDKALSNDILNGINISFQNVDASDSSICFHSEVEGNKSSKESNTFFNYILDFTIEEIADILKEISHKVSELPSLMLKSDSVKKNEMLKIISIVENSLKGSHIPDGDDYLPLATNSEELSFSIKNISKTFYLLSDKLHIAPSEFRYQPISVLNPPKTLTKTLAYIATTDYFKNCFISVAIPGNMDIEERDMCDYRQCKLEEIKNYLPKASITGEDLGQNSGAGEIFNDTHLIKVIQNHLQNVKHYLDRHLSNTNLQNSCNTFLNSSSRTYKNQKDEDYENLKDSQEYFFDALESIGQN